MITNTYEEFISSLNQEIPPFEKFIKIGDLTALFQDEMNRKFIRLNYERGPMLYALTKKLRPKNILEIGTARGFGTLCMAWAMIDSGNDGKIYTIDPVPIRSKRKVPIDENLGKGPEIKEISVEEIWNKIENKDLIEKIIPISGYSGQIMKNNEFPKFDFAYIDGAHFFDAVKHDFYAFLRNANDKFGVLLDDYIDREYYGIKKLIDEEISHEFDVTMIKSDRQNHLGQLFSLKDLEYGMCWLDSNSLKKPLKEIHSDNKITNHIEKYLKFENRLRKRDKINQSLPFMKNVRIRFWK